MWMQTQCMPGTLQQCSASVWSILGYIHAHLPTAHCYTAWCDTIDINQSLTSVILSIVATSNVVNRLWILLFIIISRRQCIFLLVSPTYHKYTSRLGTTVFRGMQNFQPSCGICAFLRNFYIFTEFCGIRYWTVIRVQIQHILMEFGPPYCMYTRFHHEIHDCHSCFDGTNTEILSWAYLKYCRLISQTDCICQLQLPATNTAYLVGFRGHRN